MLTDQLEKIRFGGDEAAVRRISIRGLLPDTEHYMTYEGSTTAPACHETVTWMVLNKPIYITKQQVRFYRDGVFRRKCFSMDHFDLYYSNTSFIIRRSLSTNLTNTLSSANSFQLHALRRLMQGGPDSPKAPLGNNFRPPQPLLHRPVRTNIDFLANQQKTTVNGKVCPTMSNSVHYKGKQRGHEVL